MTQEIRVPEVSEGVTEGKVISIAVGEGDHVEADQTLLELETDKAVVAIPSPFDGEITAVKVGEGDTVQIGQVIMVGQPSGDAVAPATGDAEPVADADQAEPPRVEKATAARPDARESQDARPEIDAHEAPEAKEAPDAQEAPDATTAAQPPSAAAADPTSVRTGDEVAPAAPATRRLARELGVDIYQVTGSGPGGRISADDVHRFVQATMQSLSGGAAARSAPGSAAAAAAARPLPDFTRWGEVAREPLATVRELTAEAMGYAWTTVPMVTQYDRADLTELEAYRKRFNQTAAPEAKLTTTAILLKVCAAALRAFPRFNSSLDWPQRELIVKRYIHIGVAVDTPTGLLVPVIRDVDTKGIEQLAVELNELAAKTRERRVNPADLEGGSFSISNLGGIGGTAFTPLVYAPQVAILGVSRAAVEPVHDGTHFQPRLILPLSLTYDHRVIDGADGARFLRWICEALTQPINLVMKG